MPDPDEQQPTPWNHEYGPEVDDLGMKLMDSYVPRLDDIDNKVKGPYVLVVEDRSSLQLDDRHLGAWRGGQQIVAALQAANDALLTLRMLVIEHRTIPMTALYPLLRACIESASLAIYLLEPKLRDDRLRRAYSVAYEDARLRSVNEIERGVANAKKKLGDIEKELRELVGERPALGDPTAFKFEQVQYGYLVGEAGAALERDPAVEIESDMSLLGMWQMLSGASHGKHWAMVQLLERSGAVVDDQDASAYVRMTTSPAVIAWFLERAIQAMEGALRLYGQRSKATWAQPEDAAEPASIPYIEQRKTRTFRRGRLKAEAAGMLAGEDLPDGGGVPAPAPGGGDTGNS